MNLLPPVSNELLESYYISDISHLNFPWMHKNPRQTHIHIHSFQWRNFNILPLFTKRTYVQIYRGNMEKKTRIKGEGVTGSFARKLCHRPRFATVSKIRERCERRPPWCASLAARNYFGGSSYNPMAQHRPDPWWKGLVARSGRKRGFNSLEISNRVSAPGLDNVFKCKDCEKLHRWDRSKGVEDLRLRLYRVV